MDSREPDAETVFSNTGSEPGPLGTNADLLPVSKETWAHYLMIMYWVKGDTIK